MRPNAFLPLVAFTVLVSGNPLGAAEPRFTPPASPARHLQFQSWLEVHPPGRARRQEVSFDDSQWETVSTPHSFTMFDSFRVIIDHSGGDRGTYKGLSWYRKHFKLPAGAAGSKVFVEFEGMRQAGDIYFNGKPFGLYENGISGYGVDLTSAALFGDRDNVLAVQVDNRTSYKERATDTSYRWNANDFNPTTAGSTGGCGCASRGGFYQTLPLYYGLGTTGTYVYCANYNIAGRTCDVTVESQVHNATADRRTPQANVTLSGAVVDKDGVVRAHVSERRRRHSSRREDRSDRKRPLADARFWSPDDPYLYDVYTVLTVDGKVVDVDKVTTGFRKTEYKGGAGAGGVYINDKFVYLKGFAQRTSNEMGRRRRRLSRVDARFPPPSIARFQRKLHALDARWRRRRWMWKRLTGSASSRSRPPATRKRNAQGRQWEQRVEVIARRHRLLPPTTPACFLEAGNTGVTASQMRQMVDMRRELDPHGGRVMGCRSLTTRGRGRLRSGSGQCSAGPTTPRCATRLRSSRRGIPR